ncbi:hypothetical protein [Marinobacterium rhizophilum]|uniref:Transmembrane protein n=1 Tax=Marinobacterium rhizophilum TaxID=420402 RepID=A0ABY5HQC6_9GAMM|nr:hypothetical protein [Marinobacterium rhizophilum]UTW13370.1 hypothetical protein KDW95_06880 [Marinobacterium rhizophilum]
MGMRKGHAVAFGDLPADDEVQPPLSQLGLGRTFVCILANFGTVPFFASQLLQPVYRLVRMLGGSLILRRHHLASSASDTSSSSCEVPAPCVFLAASFFSFPTVLSATSP